MALEKTVEIDKVEIVGPFKVVQARQATVVKEDGEEISRTFHRASYAPDADLTDVDADVAAICNLVHTTDIKNAYAASLVE